MVTSQDAYNFPSVMSEQAHPVACNSLPTADAQGVRGHVIQRSGMTLFTIVISEYLGSSNIKGRPENLCFSTIVGMEMETVLVRLWRSVRMVVMSRLVSGRGELSAPHASRLDIQAFRQAI